MRFAYVDDLNIIATVESLFQFSSRDFFHLVFGCGWWLRCDSAELFVIDQLFDGRIVAAHRAIGILAQLQLAKAHSPRVEQQQTINHDVGRAEDDLNRFVGLNGADDSRQHAQHAALGARRHQPRRRRFGIQAAVARAAFGPENARLSFETKDGTVDVGFAGEHTGVVDEIARRKVVGAVNNHIVVTEKLKRVRAGQTGFVSFDLDVRIDVFETIARRSYFRTAYVARAVNDLSLQVRSVNHIEINQSKSSHAGRRQIHSQRRAQTAGANHQHAGSFQLSLTGHADLWNNDVPAVARDLFVRKHWEPIHLCLRRAGILARGVFQHGGATRNRRHNQKRVAIFHRRVGSVLVADVFVIEIHVDEIAERVLIVEKVPAQFGVRGREQIQSLSGSRGFDFDFGLPAGKLAQGGWYGDSYWHDSSFQKHF